MTSSANLVGTTLGTYEIEALLGTGGMSSVYRALDRNLRRPVAIKVLSDAAGSLPGFAERFRQEARLIASLRHPNVVQVYDFGEQHGHSYMVQELLPGPTLAQRLRDLEARGERMPRDEALAIAVQLAGALDAAHAAGIVHRDVKPANAIWSAGGALVLTDFGIAKNTLLATSQTQTGMVIGTPDYLSPEQARGLPPTPASDIYSLGVVLYEMLSGSLPFSATTPLGVVVSHMQDAPPPLLPLRPDLPPDAERVVLQALAKDPPARFRSASALAQTLERAWPATFVPAPSPDVHHLPTQVWPAAARPAQPAALADALPIAETQPGHQRAAAPSRRSSRAPLVTAVVLAALLIGGGAVAWRASQRVTATPAATGAPAVAAPPAAPEPTIAPPAAPEPTAARPTPEPQPTAAPEPTAAPPTPEPQPTAAPAASDDPVGRLSALIEAGEIGSRSLKDDLLGDLEQARKALADGNKKRAVDRLRDFQKRVVEGRSDDKLDDRLAQRALDGVDAIARAYDLKLPPAKGKT